MTTENTALAPGFGADSQEEIERYIPADIREFYEDKTTGEEKPGSKGIALNMDQWLRLKGLVSFYFHPGFMFVSLFFVIYLAYVIVFYLEQSN